jgi:biopolymer transport protein ExbD
MARSFRRSNRREAISEIDITPLIDLAFSLLIIFMISTPLLEQTIQIDLPSEAVRPQKPLTKEDVVAISIDENNQVFWKKNNVSIPQLDDLLAEAALDSNQPIIHLRADGRLPYQSVIDVLDLIKKHHLNKLNLDTRAE